MTNEAQNPQDSHREEPLIPEKLGAANMIAEIFYGVAIALGLATLWVSESVRNVFLRLLDRMNVKPRIRRASAFPPGPSRENTTVQARR